MTPSRDFLHCVRSPPVSREVGCSTTSEVPAVRTAPFPRGWFITLFRQATWLSPGRDHNCGTAPDSHRTSLPDSRRLETLALHQKGTLYRGGVRLYLIQHGQAETEGVDPERPLTED